jgi:hypothetical protein
MALPELPLPLLHRATIAGALEPVAAELEAVLVPAADATRVAITWMAVPGRRLEPCEGALDDGTSVEVGPSAMGGFVRVAFDAERLPRGGPVAPAAAAALTAADRRFDLGLGPLEPAVAVR